MQSEVCNVRGCFPLILTFSTPPAPLVYTPPLWPWVLSQPTMTNCLLWLHQVAWQQLTEASPMGMTQQSGNLLSAAAVVTSQRLLIVGPDLTVLASTPQRSGGAFITSALWVGPALLYCDSANAVRLLLDK